MKDLTLLTKNLRIAEIFHTLLIIRIYDTLDDLP